MAPGRVARRWFKTAQVPEAAAPLGRRAGPAPGFTLVELMVVLVLLGLLGAMAAPSLGNLVQRHRLLEAGHTVQADLALARHQALRSGRDAHLQFQAARADQPWCYAVSLGSAVDCRRADARGQALKVVQGDSFPQVMLLHGQALVLDGRSGLRQGPQAQAVLATPQGPRLALQLGPMGRLALCAPQGGLPDMAPCSAEAARPN